MCYNGYVYDPGPCSGQKREEANMRQKKNRLLALLLAAALCAAMLPLPASAAASGVKTWSDKIGSGTAKLVTVTMGGGRTGEISLANNSVVESAAVSTLINQKNKQANTHVVAAINGGFFNSYTSGSWSFPNNCPVVMDAVVTNNKLIHTGRTATLGFTADGKAMVDWVELKAEVRLGNGYAVTAGYGVNTYNAEPWAIMLFNEHLTLPVTVPSSSTMVLIQNNVVKSIESGYRISAVPKGMDILVYNSEAAQLYQEWGQFPEVGMSVNIVLTASGTSRDSAWAGVESALTGGPVLVKNYKNVVDDQRNSSFYSDSKQKPDTVLARSFVGVMANGDLVMGTVTASFRQIANWMVASGIMEGIAMDGGGSCMLYAEGSGYLATGRNLATALTIVDRTGSGGLPAESNVGSPGTDTPPDWAVNEIQAAIKAGLVPDNPINLQKGYRDPITRQDFCLLIEKLARKDPNFIAKLYSNPDEPTFSDVTNLTYAGQIICWVGQMRVIDGKPNGNGTNRFDPYDTLTREQAAKILALTVQFVSGIKDTGERYNFTDRDSFPGWDQGWIDFCGVNGIMSGVGEGRFNPKGTFTRQEAILTMMRIFNTYLN